MIRKDDIPSGYHIEQFDLIEGYVIVGIDFEHFGKEAAPTLTWRSKTFTRGPIEAMPVGAPYCSMRRYNLAVDHIGVHASHCCKQHGCKYGDPDCPVEFGDEPQKYPCEMCADETDEQAEYEHEIHRILNRTSIPRFDQQFPVLMRINGLVDHFNGLVALVQAHEPTEVEKKLKLAVEALKEIKDPVVYMQIEAQERGCQLDGTRAVALAKDPSYLRSLAAIALAKLQ